jgi:hypothetical protein
MNKYKTISMNWLPLWCKHETGLAIFSFDERAIVNLERNCDICSKNGWKNCWKLSEKEIIKLTKKYEEKKEV